MVGYQGCTVTAFPETVRRIIDVVAHAMPVWQDELLGDPGHTRAASEARYEQMIDHGMFEEVVVVAN